MSQPTAVLPENQNADRQELVFFLALSVVAVLGLWILPARSSWQLDETATFWVIKDGLRTAIARSLEWTGQSPLYYVIARLAFALGGRQEILLRIPSLLSMSIAAWMLYRVAARLFDPATARTALLLFVCFEPVAYAAADARPYALALAMLNGSALLLLRWLDTGMTRYAVGYTFVSALTVWAHYLFGTGLVALGAYALYRTITEKKVGIGALLASWIAGGLAIVPLASQLATFYRSRDVHSFAGTPQPVQLLESIAPSVMVASVVLGFLIAWLVGVLPGCTATFRKDNGILAVGWALFPLVVCYLISLYSQAKLFVPRYYLSCAPGLALVIAWVLRSQTGVLSRQIVAAAVLAGSLLSFGLLPHGGDDWAGALRTVRSVTAGAAVPVLTASGFVEGTDPGALADPRLRDVLFAPFLAYPSGGKLIRLPFRLDDLSTPYLESVLHADLEYQNRFLFVCRWQGASFEPWLRGRLAARGFQSKSLGAFGNVGVFLFSVREER